MIKSKIVKALVFLAIAIFVFASTVFSQSPPVIITVTNRVTLAWDPSPDSSVTGYKIYYGIASGVYTNNISFGNVTNATITNLVSLVTYYFAATAYNAQGDESVFSNEASYSVPAITNYYPTISSFSNINMKMNTSTAKIPFVVYDVDSPITNLYVFPSYTNLSLLSSNSFLFTGNGSNRNMYITPTLNKTGNSLVTISVRDISNNVSSSSFLLTVINDTNRYTRLVYALRYGTNLNNMATTNINLVIFTNPPANQGYSGSLILTNVSF